MYKNLAGLEPALPGKRPGALTTKPYVLNGWLSSSSSPATSKFLYVFQISIFLSQVWNNTLKMLKMYMIIEIKVSSNTIYMKHMKKKIKNI